MRRKDGRRAAETTALSRTQSNERENRPEMTAECRPPRSVLFLCGRNSIRSPIAEALARHMLPRSILVGSAGVREGVRNPFVDAVLAEKALSLGDWQPRQIDELEEIAFDVIVTLSPEAHHRALELTRSNTFDVEYWPTFDPSVIEGTREQVMTAYRDVRDSLARRIADRFGLKAPDEGG